ncbi:MAG: alpha/beta hydrolase [Xanthobacteraceae bacterium]|nr:alpha/beta hydrolase [Xanthobacteraceae bacterium]
MQTNKISRRTAIAGAAAGGVLLATSTASAQRCPATPPARSKGPAIWLDYDQHDMDEMYDQSVFAFNQKHLLARSDANNVIATATIGKSERFAYGSDPIEGVDVWKTRRPNAPVLIYLHGGSWQSGRSADFALYAEPYINAGAHFVSVDFTNVRATRGDLFPMVDQCRRAVAWTYRNAAKFGGDPERLYLCSRSSGSHLAGCVVTTDWDKLGVPRTVLKGAVMGSGMYDLKPVRMSARSKFVKFTDEMEHELSAMRHIDRVHAPLVLAIGTLETPEFQRQSRDFAAALAKAGKPVELIVGQHYNHFEVGDTIGHPYQLIGRALMKMMNLSMAA